jgi:exonuclease SbcD
MGDKGDVSIEVKTLKPLHDMRAIKGTMKQLLDEKNVVNPDDYIFVTLTDEDVINDAMTIFRQTYPNTMQIRYENSHTKEIEMVDPSKITEMRSFPELISDFYYQMYQIDISDEEMAIMNQVARKVGIIDETN